jgi:hypothetical protein
MQKKIALVAVASMAAVASAPSFATGIDLTSLTGSLSASDVTVPVLSVAATLAVIYVTIKAAKIVLAKLRGG